MELCAKCKAIRIDNLPHISLTGIKDGIEHSTWNFLSKSAESCPFCRLIKWSLGRSLREEFPQNEQIRYTRSIEDNLDGLPSRPVLLGPIRRTDDANSAIIGIRTGIGGLDSSEYEGFFHVFANEGMYLVC